MRSKIIFLILFVASAFAGTNASFEPPKGWHLADEKSLPKHVLIMVVGKGAHEMPPSMNLGYEKFDGSLKEYLKIVKNVNVSQGDKWQDLGMIQTKAGPASLSQIEMKTEWGQLRQMHLIYKDSKNELVYILSAAALKDEFSQFYQDFFNALKSFNIVVSDEA